MIPHLRVKRKEIPDVRLKLEAEGDLLFGDQKGRALSIFDSFDKIGFGQEIYHFFISTLTNRNEYRLDLSEPSVPDVFAETQRKLEVLEENRQVVYKPKRISRVIGILENIFDKYGESESVDKNNIHWDLHWAFQKFP